MGDGEAHGESLWRSACHYLVAELTCQPQPEPALGQLNASTADVTGERVVEAAPVVGDGADYSSGPHQTRTETGGSPCRRPLVATSCTAITTSSTHP